MRSIKLSDRGLELIQRFEGEKEGKINDDCWQAYLDRIAKPPVWTIYYGLTKGVYEGMRITRAQGDEMMRRELIACEVALENMVSVSLNQNQIDALISFIYNVGPGSPNGARKGFYWSSLRKAVNAGQFEQCPPLFMRYVNAGGRPVNGLINRRRAEAALFIQPPFDDDVNEKGETMPQSVEHAPAMTVTQAIKTSPTAGAAGVSASVSIGTLIYNWFNDVGQVVTDAGASIIATKTATGPFNELFAAAHINMTTLVLAIIAGCSVFAMIRHIIKKRGGQVS